MSLGADKKDGFTIVELLIVIVVIAILAAITIVAYNGIRERSQVSSVQSQLSQAMKKVQSSAVLNAEQYPATLAEAGVVDGNGITYQYTSDNSTSPKKYCITATLNTTLSYYLSSTTGSAQQVGICPGHNLLVWYEDAGAATSPITFPSGGVNVDTAVKRNGTSSIRLNPNTYGVPLRNSPFTLTSGQTITITLWVKSDPGWNGLGNNSKIRIFNGANNALITACSYDGVKLDWTQATCSYTSNGTIPTIGVSVGNDGTTGQIWIDDLSLSITTS